MKYLRLVILAVPLIVCSYALAQVYNGNSGVAVGVTPAICVNAIGKKSYSCRNRSAGPTVWCWYFSGSSTPVASPTPGAGVALYELPGGTSISDHQGPQEPYGPFAMGIACAEPVATSTAILDGTWR